MRLSAHDASFLYAESASGPMHSVVISILGGPATFEEIFAYYEARIHLLPRLRQKLVFVPFNVGHPKWIDDVDFLLANHIVRHEVPRNTTVRRAVEIALELGETLLDRSKPLWKIYVLTGIEESGHNRTMLVQMSHHAFIDGATTVAMTTVFTDPEPDAPAPESAPDWQPEKAPAPSELWQEAVAENARDALQQGQQMAQNAQTFAAISSQGGLLLQRMARPVMQAPWNASLVGPKRAIGFLSYPLSDFKPIRKALGGTINDIVVTVVSEAAARYLASKKEQVTGQSLRLMCPVNVRDEEQDPLNMGGNRVSAMFPIVSAQPMTVIERFTQIHAELNEIKQQDEPSILDQIQQLQPNVPPIAMAQTLGVGTQWDPTLAAAMAPLPVMPVGTNPRPQQLGFNFTCTNVPGPTWTQYVAGYKVDNMFGTLMLGGNLGFGCGISSYDGKMNFIMTCDPRLMPDVERFRDFVAECLAELSEVADNS